LLLLQFASRARLTLLLRFSLQRLAALGALSKRAVEPLLRDRPGSVFIDCTRRGLLPVLIADVELQVLMLRMLLQLLPLLPLLLWSLFWARSLLPQLLSLPLPAEVKLGLLLQLLLQFRPLVLIAGGGEVDLLLWLMQLLLFFRSLLLTA